MPSTFEPALPVKAAEVPSGPDSLHEIKHDGYRMMLIREAKVVRLRSKTGLDWTQRFPWIVESALKLRQDRFVIDGEAVVLGVDGISDFDALQSGKYNNEVQLYAFDMLAGEGDDYRKLPLFLRKQNLARLLVRRPEAIQAAPFEQGEIGPDLFRAACRMGLEGLVSKHRERAYRAGRCDHWVKVKNRDHPGYGRVKDVARAKRR
ncbi:bifunctional non-homologous end joining protein LigD [Bradyrhizobium barranii subsp. barranii]|uniref:DNA ligase n=1 Tax=Bradyrhizobium barranii subsp. barranii TaxID=2823807 RepID=A0A939MFV8_9BRAD|nr:DNA ligase [Bradyrhizobium barranii]UEM12000.1 DNA ligase [Bradyrhizobium barranii subsp. barranii]